MRDLRLCPRCDAAGREVGPLTVRSLVLPSLASTLVGEDRRFCATPTCPVVYYGGDGAEIRKDQLSVRVGLKEATDRLVCYCFGHTVDRIHDEIERTGRSDVLQDITAKIRAGLCACETRNPEGVCCLGRVRAAVADGFSRRGSGVSASRAPAGVADCCARPERVGISAVVVEPSRQRGAK